MFTLFCSIVGLGFGCKHEYSKQLEVSSLNFESGGAYLLAMGFNNLSERRL